MTINLRELLSRRDRLGEFISVRNALKNHLDVSGTGLRVLHKRFTNYNTTRGLDCGCRNEKDFQIGLSRDSVAVAGGLLGGLVGGPIGAIVGGLIGLEKGKLVRDIGGIVPSWVHAVPRANRDRPRFLEGVLRKSRLTREDFPLKPWHTFYDWNYFVEVDPQYRYLLNETTARQNTGEIFPEKEKKPRDIIECEWDTAFVPLWALPPVDSRIWIYGRWIFDCGHPEDGVYRLEIHPPKATAWYRSEAARFPGNSGPTRANNAVLYIGRRGGYIDQAINDEDYEFDIPLPPRPHPDAIALGTFRRPPSDVTGLGTPITMPDPLPVEPRFSPVPERDPKVMRVTIPLNGAASSLKEFGAIISAGWSDPAGSEVRNIRRFRVTLQFVVAELRLVFSEPDETGQKFQIGALDWLFLIAVNGRWHLRMLNNFGAVTTLNIVEELDLHENDRIQITACGFRILDVHQFMGEQSGVTPRITREGSSDADAAAAVRAIRDSFLRAIREKKVVPLTFENLHIHHFSRIHEPRSTGPLTAASADFLGPFDEHSGNRSYELHYQIEEI